MREPNRDSGDPHWGRQGLTQACSSGGDPVWPGTAPEGPREGVGSGGPDSGGGILTWLTYVVCLKESFCL